jgi:hypothetical protein
MPGKGDRPRNENRENWVREESQIDDMRAAVRGDLERARARRPSIFERPAAPPPAAEEPDPQPESRPEPEPELELVPEPSMDPPSERRLRDRLGFWRR